MKTPKNYVDIGHLNDSILWVWRKGKIETASSANGRTHEKVWGVGCMNNYRGRFDPETGQISITPPFKLRNRATPTWLLDALEREFGTGNENWEFNPGKPPRRR